MRLLSWSACILGPLAGLLVVVAVLAVFLGLRMPESRVAPKPVPAGDAEIAWLHIPTAYEAWDSFVRGAKRAQRGGLVVDHSAAYPEITTDVPEVVLSRAGVVGAVRIRWYKVTDEAGYEGWVAALARRDPPPLAVVGGWSSDRAKYLADALREASWRDDRRPVYFLTQATADQVGPVDTDPDAPAVPPLISLYDRSFRICFTNRQMARAVTDFILSDPTLRPGPILPAGLRSAPSAIGTPWAVLTGLAGEVLAGPRSPAGFAVRWQDDPYSVDLCDKLREEFRSRSIAAGATVLTTSLHTVPFSTGRFHRVNPGERQVVEEILARLPPPGLRTVLLVPTVTAPARRTLLALVQGDPMVGRKLVAVTGDGLGVNTLVRDRDFAWPVQALTIPFVLFTHDHPFRWDRPEDDPPPPGYELLEPPPGVVPTSSEDVQLYNRLTRLIVAMAFPERPGLLIRDPAAAADRLRRLDPPFFDTAGDRRDDTGEHIVLLRPLFPGDRPEPPGLAGHGPQVEATLEVFTRQAGSSTWERIDRLLLPRTSDPRPR